MLLAPISGRSRYGYPPIRAIFVIGCDPYGSRPSPDPNWIRILIRSGLNPLVVIFIFHPAKIISKHLLLICVWQFFTYNLFKVQIEALLHVTPCMFVFKYHCNRGVNLTRWEGAPLWHASNMAVFSQCKRGRDGAKNPRFNYAEMGRAWYWLPRTETTRL